MAGSFNIKPQSASERYTVPENYLEIEVTDAQLQGFVALTTKAITETNMWIT